MKTRRLLTLFVAVQIYSLTLTSLAIIYTGYTKWYKVDNAATTNSTREDEEVPIDVKTTSTAATTHYEEDNFVELADHDDWIHTGNEVYLYSAHWDNRSDIAMGTSVRVMGIVPVSIIEINVGITCLLWYKNKTKAIKITADIEFLQDHHEKPSRAAFIICPSPNEQFQPPYAVSLQLASQEKRLAVGLPNPLPVRMILNHSGNITDKIAVCVKPVRKIISSTLTVAEFIAFYRAVGVTKFVFFSTGLTAEVWLFLRKLANKIGLEVDLLPWNLYKRSEDVHDNARIISINYCIYRYMTSDFETDCENSKNDYLEVIPYQYEPVLQAGTAANHAVECSSSEGGRGDSDEVERDGRVGNVE
ncbi:hypothetical protein GQR58_015943 [Nymphon striatum]|nr:hypothetical protein GQR58_015943 [Nymphon striatum]